MEFDNIKMNILIKKPLERGSENTPRLLNVWHIPLSLTFDTASESFASHGDHSTSRHLCLMMVYEGK